MTISIVRNEFAPQFDHPTYAEVTINEYIQIGDSIYDVNATDPDSKNPYSANVSRNIYCLGLQVAY